MVTARQLGVDDTLVGGDDELVESGRGVTRERMIEQLAEGRTADQGDCGDETLRRSGMIGVARRIAAGCDERLEPNRVDGRAGSTRRRSPDPARTTASRPSIRRSWDTCACSAFAGCPG